MKTQFHHWLSLGVALSTATASAWLPGEYTSPMPSKGFSVNNSVRNDVMSFWHAIYMASEGYQNRVNWTGSYTGNNHDSNTGTTSAAFVLDVERRLNFHRALAGAPAEVSVNTGSPVIIQDSDDYKPSANITKNAAAQRAAYMISRAKFSNSLNGVDIHNPPSNLPGWTTAAWNGAARSNVTFGYYGPGAIDAYMSENDAGSNGSDNSMVKHRRWSLYQGATDYATGDTPGYPVPNTTNMYSPTNSLYVWQTPDQLTDVTSRFVTYPSAGYFPAPLNTRYWSISHPDADFSQASVTMRTSTNTLPSITKITAAAAPTGLPGDSSLVWQVNSSTHYSTEAPVDRTYRITITGIRGQGVPSSLEYTVTLFDPKNFTSDQTLSGSDTAPANGSANYFLTRPDAAEEVTVDVFTSSSAAWTETAEISSITTVINKLYTSGDPTNPYSAYNFISPAVSSFTTIAGSRSFRLTHPVRYDIVTEGVPDEVFELGREILPVSPTDSKLKFRYKRGFMTVNSKLAVEYTQDDGATWTAFGSVITGKTANVTLNDNAPLSWEGALPPSNEPYRIRFRYYRENTNGTAITVHAENPTQPTGMFIDDITTENCRWLELKQSTDIPPDNSRFVFNAASASDGGTPLVNGSQHRLRMRTMLGGKWFKYGPTKLVTVTNNPTPGFAGWLQYEYPMLTGGFDGDHDGDGVPNSIEYAFMLDPLSPDVSRDTLSFPGSQLQKAPGDYISISRPANGVRDGLTAEWSETLAPNSWSGQGVTVSYDDSSKTATAMAPAGNAKRFLRWKITTP